MPFSDTIFALSTGSLPSGVAVIRLSGQDVRLGLETFFGKVPEPRAAAYGCFRRRDGAVIDTGFAFYFPEPRSFTGEDCGEIQVHGSRAVISALLHELAGLQGFRHAEAGEFTRRAFLNGKLDLTGAEALADLLAAETEAQRELALSNMKGAQRELYDGWRKRLLHARAMIEAELDFADEGDVPGSLADTVWEDMARLRGEVGAHIQGFARAEIVRDGVKVVIVGAPNAGKSSLLNALARRDAAIVSDQPGTTRDLVEVSLDLDGVKVVLTDTAGIREDAGAVEQEGIARARGKVEQAHLVLLLEDMSAPAPINLTTGAVPLVSVGTKLDLALGGNQRGYDHHLSVKDGRGVDALLEWLAVFARDAGGRTSDALPSRLRHLQHLTTCRQELETALRETLPVEIRAEHLRLAAHALGRIVGRVDVEDLLGAIFSEFCIGK